MQFSTQPQHHTTMDTKSPNITFVEKMKGFGTIRSPEVEKVMKSIDRADFVRTDPYFDCPQPIGFNATISAPHMHAYAMEFLKDRLKTAKSCLDVGSGSGYLTLAFAKLMEEPEAVSYGVEHIPQLVKESIANIEKNHASFLNKGKVIIKEGDGRFGLNEYAPFDCIHVGAACPEVPKELIKQLAPGGRMVVPVGTSLQDFLIIDKDMNGEITQQSALGVQYVPLCDKKTQLGKKDLDL